MSIGISVKTVLIASFNDIIPANSKEYFFNMGMHPKILYWNAMRF
jgi:hypothetical protein